MNKILLVSHCVLNQNAVVNGWERAKSAFPFVGILLEKDIAILQMPCPELGALGMKRPPMNYEEYDRLNGYRELCNKTALDVVYQLQEYINNGYQYAGVIGIHESPTCSISGQRGVLMEELMKESKKCGISHRVLEVPTWYSAKNYGDFHTKLIKWIEEGEK